MLEVTQAPHRATQMGSPSHGAASKRRRVEIGWEVLRDRLQPHYDDFNVIPWYVFHKFVQVLKSNIPTGHSEKSLFLGCRSPQCSPVSTRLWCPVRSWFLCSWRCTSSWQSSAEVRGACTCCAASGRWRTARPAVRTKPRPTELSWTGSGFGFGLFVCEVSAHPTRSPSVWICWPPSCTEGW